MNLPDSEILGRLGDGEEISAVCSATGITRTEFDRWWRETTKRRASPSENQAVSGISGCVKICRDGRGIPHIFAEQDRDLFFGYGWAMAEDRLFQLDWLRRKGQGRLAEIAGPDALPLDLTARTVGLHRIAQEEWQLLPAEVRQLLEAFSMGINQYMARCGSNLPIEFDLLRYRPERWTPVDSLAIESEFRWYLTGRFPVLCMPELAKRILGDGPLYEQFLQGECDEESILHPGDYPQRRDKELEPIREAMGSVVSEPDSSTGSNNWVLAGKRTVAGAPLVASDPHIAFEAVSCWYEAHLCGGSFHVAGMTYVGMPAIMFGRSERVAWGITNNICSLRDLYQERTDADHPGCFLYNGVWEPAREIQETIPVRGAEPVVKTIRFSRNGPVVDEILPAPADRAGPVSLKWLGMHAGGWLESLLGINRANTATEFREALRPWHVPTFSLVFADVEGNVGYHAAGRIPIRSRVERGFRRGWDPDDQWRGLLAFEAMPAADNPPRGWIATANNRVAPEDFPYPLAGTWNSGWRARRIRQWIEEQDRLSVSEVQAMHRDSVSLRATALVPILLETLKSRDIEGAAPDLDRAAANLWSAATKELETWDCRAEPDSAAATIFNVFFTAWCRSVARERFDPETAEFLVKGIDGCAAQLLREDPAGWLAASKREPRIRIVFQETLDYLRERFGGDIADWTWGKLHRIPLRHVLSARGELGSLLDHGGGPVSGDMVTVGNTGGGPDWIAATGGGYRMVADLSSSPPTLLAVDGQSQSGHPGSPHYADQFDDWLAGRYHELALVREGKANWPSCVLSPACTSSEVSRE